jgi:hypothetical protein
MNVRLFVTGTASLLAAWLVATFLSEVPADSYLQAGPGSVPVSAKVGNSPVKPVAAATTAESPSVAGNALRE